MMIGVTEGVGGLGAGGQLQLHLPPDDGVVESEQHGVHLPEALVAVEGLQHQPEVGVEPGAGAGHGPLHQVLHAVLWDDKRGARHDRCEVRSWGMWVGGCGVVHHQVLCARHAGWDASGGESEEQCVLCVMAMICACL